MLWSYDTDKSIPFPSDNASGSHTTSRHAPATVVAAVCWTTRISHPSRWYLEEAGASESASSTPAHKSAGIKHKATSTLVNQCATHKIVNVVSDNGIGGDSDSGSRTPSPLPTELASDNYKALKAMADADNEAAITTLCEEHTTNICLIFHCQKGYIHPVTGKSLNSHWCE
ncbi:hypothetical protein V8E53_013451, partial [Lactarius tabidus]